MSMCVYVDIIVLNIPVGAMICGKCLPVSICLLVFSFALTLVRACVLFML